MSSSTGRTRHPTFSTHAITCTQRGSKREPTGSRNTTAHTYRIIANEDEIKYGTAIVDTGASTNLLSTEYEGTLSNATSSTACIQGFEGTDEIKGSCHGIGHMYILGDGAGRKGFQLSTTFDTVKNINSNLFSISSLYEDHGFSLFLTYKSQSWFPN